MIASSSFSSNHTNLLYELHLIHWKQSVSRYTHSKKKRKINITARTHLGAFNRPERQRAEDTGTVERVESNRPLSIRLPLYGRKVVGVLERIDTLATAGEKRNVLRKKKKKKKNSSNRVISFGFAHLEKSRSQRRQKKGVTRNSRKDRTRLSRRGKGKGVK